MEAAQGWYDGFMFPSGTWNLLSTLPECMAVIFMVAKCVLHSGHCI